MNIWVIFDVCFGWFKRSVMIDDHEKRIKKIEETTVPKVEDLNKYIKKIKKAKEIFKGIQIEAACDTECDIFKDMYDNMFLDLSDLDLDETDINKAHAIVKKHVELYYFHAETIHDARGTPVELYEYVVQAMRDPTEDLKEKYYKDFIDVFNNNRGQHRLDEIRKQFDFFIRELKSTFKLEFYRILRGAKKIN